MTTAREIVKDIEDIEYAETNLNLETNANIINEWKWFEAKNHKKRRSFVKKQIG